MGGVSAIPYSSFALFVILNDISKSHASDLWHDLKAMDDAWLEERGKQQASQKGSQ